jgi:hypothetical protein
MKPRKTSEFEPQLPHANHGAVHLFLGPLPALLLYYLYLFYDYNLPTKDFAMPNIYPICGKPVDIYISRGRILAILPLRCSPWCSQITTLVTIR